MVLVDSDLNNNSDQEATACAARWKQTFTSHGEGKPGSSESKAMWDRKAPSFAKKRKRSDYITQLIHMLNLGRDESVFDMGCGSGTLAIPLALEDHKVYAIDFSDGMLEQLHEAARAEEVEGDRLKTFQRSWQQDWSDLPSADVAVASRSFITDDLVDGIAKLESKANERVAITLKAGDLPYRDSKIHEALGREPKAFDIDELSCLVSYLYAIGRLPKVDYIEYPGKTCRDTKDELYQSFIDAYQPTDEEKPLLDAYLEEHIIHDKDLDAYCLDYDRTDRWALVTWDVPGAMNTERAAQRVFTMAVKACIFKDDRMLFLHKPEDGRLRSAYPDRIEDLPGGCVEDQETWEEALKREVMEETGLTIEVGRPFNTWSIIAPDRQVMGADFICKWVSGDVKLSWEHESYEWLTLDELRQKHWELQDLYENAYAINSEQS